MHQWALWRQADVQRALPASALTLAAAAWGSTFVINKAALEDVGPFTILAWRFPLALLVVLAVAWRRRARLRMAMNPRLLVFGVPLALHFGLQTAGLEFTTASRGALIVAGVPIVIAVGAVPVLGERLTAGLAAGIVLSVVGVTALIGAPSALSTPAMLRGDLLVAASVIAWAWYTLQGRQLAGGNTALETTLASTLGATVLLLVAAGLEWGATGLPSMSGSTILLLTYLGIVPSAIALLAWNWALQHVPAAVAGPFVNLVPVTGVAFALLAGEVLSASELGGAALVGAGLWLAHRNRHRATGGP